MYCLLRIHLLSITLLSFFRYIICKWLKENTKDICDYMFEVNGILEKYSSTCDKDVNEVVPLDVLKEDEEFYEYIVNSNNV